MNIRYKLIGFSAPILALSLSVFITSLILTAIGKDPIETFILMYDYGTTGKSLVSVFNRFESNIIHSGDFSRETIYEFILI